MLEPNKPCHSGRQKRRQLRIPACIAIGRARRALLRVLKHVRHATAEVDSQEFKDALEQQREQLHSIMDRLGSLSSRLRRVEKVKREGVAHG